MSDAEEVVECKANTIQVVWLEGTPQKLSSACSA